LPRARRGARRTHQVINDLFAIIHPHLNWRQHRRRGKLPAGARYRLPAPPENSASPFENPAVALPSLKVS
jgi:hypothetical protein